MMKGQIQAGNVVLRTCIILKNYRQNEANRSIFAQKTFFYNFFHVENDAINLVSCLMIRQLRSLSSRESNIHQVKPHEMSIMYGVIACESAKR